MDPKPNLPDHRAIDMEQFRVNNGTPKNKPIHRHRNDVVIAFSGLVDDREKSLRVNKSIWHAILRHAKVDTDHLHFDREFVKHVVNKLNNAGTPPFAADAEAMAMLEKVTALFSKGRALTVAGETFAK